MQVVSRPRIVKQLFCWSNTYHVCNNQSETTILKHGVCPQVDLLHIKKGWQRMGWDCEVPPAYGSSIAMSAPDIFVEQIHKQ